LRRLASLQRGRCRLAEKTLDAFGLQHTCRRVTAEDGAMSKCIFSVPPVIPARLSFRASYERVPSRWHSSTSIASDRVSLEFQSTAIDESVLEDLVPLVLGQGSSFLRGAPLSGLRRTAPGAA